MAKINCGQPSGAGAEDRHSHDRAGDQQLDPRRIYEDNDPIAEVQDPKLDLNNKEIIFPTVNSLTILGSNKSHEFRNWKVACGSTQLYNMISNGWDMITLIPP